jgi:hypothetical protein
MHRRARLGNSRGEVYNTSREKKTVVYILLELNLSRSTAACNRLKEKKKKEKGKKKRPVTRVE